MKTEVKANKDIQNIEKINSSYSVQEPNDESSQRKSDQLLMKFSSDKKLTKREIK